MPHANYAEESRIAYDDFLCRFKKDAEETATIWEKNCKRERLVDGYSTGLFSVIMGAYGEERKV